MRHELETVAVEVTFRTLPQPPRPAGPVLRTTCAVCPRCGAAGWSIGQSAENVRRALLDMRSKCRGKPYYHVYVPAPGTEPPDDLVPV